jgi:hypothetical protein
VDLRRDAGAQLGDVADQPDHAAALTQAVEHVHDLVERLLVERAEALVDEQRLDPRATGLGLDDVGQTRREAPARRGKVTPPDRVLVSRS